MEETKAVGGHHQPQEPWEAGQVLGTALESFLEAASSGESQESSRSLHLTSLFLHLDVICLGTAIPPAKVHAVSSDVGHILITI